MSVYSGTNKGCEMLALVRINGIPVWRDARTGRTFPQIAGAEEGDGDGTGSDGANADEHADDDENEDAATLRRRVQAQRAGERKLKDLLKTREDELKSLKDAQQKRDDADKSELEKAQTRLAEREKAHAESEAKLRRIQISQAIERAARKHNARNPEVVAKLIDHAALEFDDEGDPKNAEDLVKLLLKTEPYLVGTGTTSNGVPATPRGSGPAGHDEQVKKNLETLRGLPERQPL